MRKQLLLLIVFLTSANSISLFGQETLPQKIQSYFETYQKEYPVEKAYLHLDKNTYTLGEDLWFSAYLTAGSSQIPSPLSSTLYVDLFDGDGLLIEQKIIRLESGRGKGDFTFPAFGKPGIYQLKAYTSWMRNFGEEYFFNSKINVVDGAGGSFLPKIDFTSISAADGKVTYKADLIVIDSEGNPLAGKTVEIIAKAGDDELYKQELPLNSQGQVSFTFTIPEKANPSQHLELTFMENESYSVTQKLRLPYSLTLADIQFLPEGGHSVIGKKSIFGFRAIYPDGMPADIQGLIEGSDVSFESNFAGLGKFEFTPSQSSYPVKITEKTTTQEISIDLSKIDPQGLVMQVVNNPAASYLTAFVQGESDSNSLLLVSQTRGIINYMIQGTLANGVWGVRIPKENLISGINQITVMSEEGKPLLERLVFIQKEDQIQVDIAKNGNITPREKISLNLKSTFTGTPNPGSFSVAVLDAAQVNESELEAGDIFSTLLLTSDLSAEIYQPGRYFKDNSSETQEALDLVMLTHGWRRFEWSDVLAGDFPKVEQFIERGINIEGQVSDAEDTKKGLSGGKITALVGEGIEIVSSEYGPNGRFIFRDLDYLDSASVTITAEDSRLKNFVNVSVIQPEPVFNSIEGNYTREVIWPEGLVATYRERMMMQQLNKEKDIVDLEGVTVEAKTIEREEEEIKKIYGSGDVTLDPEKIPSSVGFTNVFQLIQGRVSGVQVFVSGLDVNVTIRGVGSLGGSGTQPLYLLDNIPVDASTLLTISPRDVSNVDVFKDPAKTAIFGAQGANGVIAVYTKTGAGIGKSVGGTLVTKYGGYAVSREFYLPKYDTKTVENAIKDARATIYWNPLVDTGENGETLLEFYNTDIASEQIIIVEGIDPEGRLGRAVRILK
ncbi:TonB-dependent receptor plug domain-containing protein [Algoriphagus pacificus]|uniref:TonB-dependent receptor plug domain-containing protein n=1 Tax=Algoriphagus pacificus TaxID=2811234 RepID=A0ABS3CEV5_9BACT|nr:TonB-dependent receptor plug domain-containing protein [Algoriphagus pacificus]MBN7815638.1 TonB-dependent receptor plug domain-containing protein [Algoriphagus pacificus]